MWAGIAQSVQQLATDWMVQGLNSGGGEIFLTVHNNLGAHLNPYKMRTWSLSWVKRPRRGVNTLPPPKKKKFSAEFKEKIQLYLHSPFGAFMACSGVNFTLS